MTPGEADAAIVREAFRDVHDDIRIDPQREERRFADLERLAVRAWPSLAAQNN